MIHNKILTVGRPCDFERGKEKAIGSIMLTPSNHYEITSEIVFVSFLFYCMVILPACVCVPCIHYVWRGEMRVLDSS